MSVMRRLIVPVSGLKSNGRTSMIVGGSIPSRAPAVDLWRATWLAVASVFALALLSNPGLAAKSFRGGQFDYYVADYVADLARLAKTIDKPKSELEADVATAEAA